MASMMSLRSFKVNIRSGPGINYPVKWTYQCKHYPVELVAKFGHWNKIMSKHGHVGWIHKIMLSRAPYSIVENRDIYMYRWPKNNSFKLAKIIEGSVVQILKMRKNWAYIGVDNIKGWVSKDNLWLVSD